MGAAFSSLTSLMVEIYNASSGAAGLGTIDGEWMKSGETTPLLVLSDATVARGICNVKGLGARKTFLTGSQSGIADGAQLNAMVGPVEAIQFAITGGRWNGNRHGSLPRGATQDQQLAWLRISTANVTANPAVPPEYVQVGGTIYHDAAGLVLGGASSVSVNATFCSFTINFAATSAQCPDDFSRAIAVGALALLFSKDGAKMDAAVFFKALFDAELASLGVPTMSLAQAA